MSLGRILTVDDQIEDLEILNHILNRENFETVSARNGKQALEILASNIDIDLIILDRMMPVMDGISFIRRLREADRFSSIPVIMQTAADDDEAIIDGVDSGVYWYVTKPFSGDVLFSIVKSAMREKKRRAKIKQLTEFYVTRRKSVKQGMQKLKCCNFEFQNLQEARDVANALACCLPNPHNFVGAIQELLVNAVEHGNLGITYEEKLDLVLGGTWEDEIEYRLNQPENKNKKVTVLMKQSEEIMTISIKDEGDGFDFKSFSNKRPEHSIRANGRGIFLAKLEFDSIQFMGIGNEVVCYKYVGKTTS